MMMSTLTSEAEQEVKLASEILTFAPGPGQELQVMTCHWNNIGSRISDRKIRGMRVQAWDLGFMVSRI